MKKNSFLLLLAAATAALTTLTACQDLDTNPSPYSEFANVTIKGGFNVADAIKNYTYRTTAGENVNISVNAPFETRIDREFDSNGNPVDDASARWILNNFGKCTGGVISLFTTKNLTNHGGHNITTDLELFVYETGKRHVDGVFNTFAYPVRIRQTGTDGTCYLTTEQVHRWGSTPNAILAETYGSDVNGSYYYVKGTVKSIGSLQTETKSAKNAVGYWTAPWAIDGNHFVNRDFDLLNMTIDVNGEEFPMRLEYMSDYKLFSNFNVKTGDTVEVCFRKAGATVKPGTYVCSPLDVFKL